MDNRIFQENIEENIISSNIAPYMLTTDNPTVIHISDEHINDDINNDLDDYLNNNLDDECLICLEKINIGDHTWTCSQCNQVFHLDCKQSWEIISPGEIFKCPHCKYESNSSQQSLEITRTNPTNVYTFEICNLYLCCKPIIYVIFIIIYIFCGLFVLYVILYNFVTYDYKFNITNV